jgi:hypothetical protein
MIRARIHFPSDASVTTTTQLDYLGRTVSVTPPGGSFSSNNTSYSYSTALFR